MTSFNKFQCTSSQSVRYWLIIGGVALLSTSAWPANFNERSAPEHPCGHSHQATTRRAVPSAELKADAGANQSICFGERAELQGSAGGGTPPYSFSWSNGAKAAVTSVHPTTSPTTYTLTVTDAAGLTATDEVKVRVHPLPVTEAGEDKKLCRHSEAVLTASAAKGTPPYAFQWSTGQIGSSIEVQPYEGADYFVTVTDRNGCSDVDRATVTYLGLDACPNHQPGAGQGAALTQPEAPEPALYQNAPNPFSEQTQIRFSLPESGAVTLFVRDASGSVVYQRSSVLQAGTYEWAVHRSALPASGYYCYSLQAKQRVLSRRMLLVR
jgi:hypothetical protein